MFGSMLRRLFAIFGAKASKALNAAENPSDTLDYSYEQMQVQLLEVKRGVVGVVTAKQRLVIQADGLRDKVLKLETQARTAMAAGKEDLARQALVKKATVQQQLVTFDSQIADLQSQQDKLTTGQAALEARIDGFRSQKEVLKAQYSSAKAQVKIGEAATGIGQGLTDTGLAIERAQGRVEEMTARAAAIDELTEAGALEDFTSSDTSLDRKLAEISQSSQVDDELASLRHELNPAT